MLAVAADLEIARKTAWNKRLQPSQWPFWLVFLRSISYVNLFARPAFPVASAVLPISFRCFR
jgi:hypothetical protein